MDETLLSLVYLLRKVHIYYESHRWHHIARKCARDSDAFGLRAALAQIERLDKMIEEELNHDEL